MSDDRHQRSAAQDRHRQTAERWSGGRSSPLHIYATTGAVTDGIIEEIHERLAVADRGLLDAGPHPDGEPQRLRELLHHVEPELAAAKARELGHGHAESATAKWEQEALGDLARRAKYGTAEVALRVLKGIDMGDPAILDMLPGPAEGYPPAGLSADCGWPEPPIGDSAAHARWYEAQPPIVESYMVEFNARLHRLVSYVCEDVLEGHEPTPTLASEAPTPARLSGPVVRPVQAAPPPTGWTVAPVGRNSLGEQVEVVYDPSRYDILVVHGEGGGRFPRLAHEDSAEVMLDALAVTGWQLHELAGDARLWVRDRPAAERQAVKHDDAGRRPQVQFNGITPTGPFLRPQARTEPIPAGWVAEPAGVLGPPDNDHVELVYNPQRHDVMRVPTSHADAAAAMLASQGWATAGSDGTTDLLWRHRLAPTLSALERPAHQPAEIRGPGR